MNSLLQDLFSDEKIETISININIEKPMTIIPVVGHLLPFVSRTVAVYLISAVRKSFAS